MKTNDRRNAPFGQGGVGDSVGLVAFDADATLAKRSIPPIVCLHFSPFYIAKS